MPRPAVRIPLVAALVAAALAGGAQLAAAAPGASRVVVVAKNDGVRTIGDLRVGPRSASDVVSTLADVREVWGRERTLKRRTCTAGWSTGVRLLFTTFGGPAPCSERFLQVAYVTGRAWTVHVGRATYAIGMPKSELPRGATFIHHWNGGGYQLASMPFVGARTATVLAHVNRRSDRVDRFVLFLGAAGD